MGALPKGYTVDSLLTFPGQAAPYLNVSEDWAVRHEDLIPGVIVESQRVKNFHPRTYIETRLKRKRA